MFRCAFFFSFFPALASVGYVAGYLFLPLQQIPSLSHMLSHVVSLSFLFGCVVLDSLQHCHVGPNFFVLAKCEDDRHPHALAGSLHPPKSPPLVLFSHALFPRACGRFILFPPRTGRRFHEQRVPVTWFF